MSAKFRVSSLVPSGLIVESIAEVDNTIVVTARAGIQAAMCPLCSSPSRRVHSRYVRRVSDLPCSGRSVCLQVVTRRLFCNTPHCRRRIFAERFDEGVVLVRSRRTGRLDCVVHHLGLALGGRPAANFAKRVMLPVSNDTVLRVVRARACPRTETLNVIGIDDWAFRRNHSYGTIVCDLGATTHRDALARPGDGDGSGLARRSFRHQGSIPRSWWRIRRGGFEGIALRHPGCRSLASHGKCERCILEHCPVNPCVRSVRRSARRRSIPNF
jgi:hypothetical protein